MSGNNKNYDWEAIEEDFRAGVLSIRMIATKYNIDESSIRGKAKRFDWKRDLSNKVKQAVNNKLLGCEARSAEPQADISGTETEQAIIEKASDEVTRLVMSHRESVAVYRKITDRISNFLVAVEINEANHQELARSLNAGIDALSKAVKIERQAYGLDEQVQQSSADDDLIALCEGL